MSNQEEQIMANMPTIDEYIEAAPSGEWISVKDRLPEPDRIVPVSFGDPSIGWQTDYITVYPECGNEVWASFDFNVTHWLDIPEPPTN